MKFLHFFLFLWAIFAFHDPDLAGQNQCGSIRIRIRNIEKTIIFLTRVQFTDFILKILTQTAGNTDVCIVLALRLQQFI